MKTKTLLLMGLAVGLMLALVGSPNFRSNAAGIYPSRWRCEGSALQTGFQPVADCRRHHHSPHGELLATRRLYATIAARIDGTLHELPLR